jgi:hypothetical protein
MKLRSLVFLLTLSAFAADSHVPDCRNITIHVQDTQLPGTTYLTYAEKEASQILAAAGFQIRWTEAMPDDSPGCGPPIVVRFTVGEQSPSYPRAIAYSLPYNPQESGITVFWDKLTNVSARTLCPEGDLLAHVLAHETTHILQALERHSETGLMRASWTNEDYYQMLRGWLPLTPVDIQLVQAGIESRAGQTARATIAAHSATNVQSADRPER